MTITNDPGTNYPNIQSVIYLVPGGVNGDIAAPYDDANAATLVVQNNADGTATGSFSYKTNAPGTGLTTLASVTCATGLRGAWSITLLNDTNVTLNGPGGLSTNVNLPSEDVAQQLANPVTAYFGSINNGTTNNAGHGVTYSEFSISGTEYSTSPTSPANPIDDVFAADAGVLSTANWAVDSSTAPNNLVIIQPTDLFWVSWTLPDEGYSLLTSPTLGTGAVWTDTGLTTFLSTTQRHLVLVPQSVLPAGGQGYFILSKTP
jgi:hypothetical protein